MLLPHQRRLKPLGWKLTSYVITAIIIIIIIINNSNNIPNIKQCLPQQRNINNINIKNYSGTLELTWMKFQNLLILPTTLRMHWVSMPEPIPRCPRGESSHGTYMDLDLSIWNKKQDETCVSLNWNKEHLQLNISENISKNMEQGTRYLYGNMESSPICIFSMFSHHTEQLVEPSAERTHRGKAMPGDPNVWESASRNSPKLLKHVRLDGKIGL